MKFAQKIAEKYGISKDLYSGLFGLHLWRKIRLRNPLDNTEFMVAYRKIADYREGRISRNEPKNPKDIFFKHIQDLQENGKESTAVWYLKEARKRALDRDNGEIARQLTCKILQIRGRKTNQMIEGVFEDVSLSKKANEDLLKFVEKTRKSDLSHVPTFESHLQNLDVSLAQLLSSFASVSIGLNRELTPYLFEENKGITNKYDDNVDPMDWFANEVIRSVAINSGLVRRYYSEEEVTPVEGPVCGKYVVKCDPLDGYSNLFSGNSLGTIITVYDRDSSKGKPLCADDAVAVMFILYGSSHAMLFASKDPADGKMHGVHKFVVNEMDDGRKKFLLLKKDIQIPSEPAYFGFGGSHPQWDAPFARFYDSMKDKKVRVFGCFVAEMFQIFAEQNSHSFAYPPLLDPRDYAKPAKPKLRLDVEVMPAAILARAAGLASWDFSLEHGSITDVKITQENVDSRIGVLIGPQSVIDAAKAAYRIERKLLDLPNY